MQLPPAHRQPDAAVRVEWGPVGAVALSDAEVVVVVDVLSFSTTTTVALDAGAIVLPHRWRDDSAAALARSRDAVLAAGRSHAEHGVPSLSPAAMRTAARPGLRIVLPSPNGATLAAALADSGTSVVAGCLRNAAAIADWAARTGARSVGVVAAGERWPDGSLRPAVEDLWGAGAVVAAIADRLGPAVSVEARVAARAWAGVADDPGTALRGCASGRELIGLGHPDDVDVAAEVDASRVVPLLVDGAFVDADAGRTTVRP